MPREDAAEDEGVEDRLRSPFYLASVDPKCQYIVTGSKQWARATKKEREALVAAFNSNGKLTRVHMGDCVVDDDLAASWASVLGSPRCAVQTLVLDSNPIGSAGIEALAAGLGCAPLGWAGLGWAGLAVF